MNIINVREIVEKFLIQNEKCRDSDTRLVAGIWTHHLKTEIHNLTALDLLGKLSRNELPNFESIRRVRQKLQELNPALRGTNYKQRQTEEQVETITDIHTIAQDNYDSKKAI